MSCVQVSKCDAVLTEKEEEVERLKEDLEHFRTRSHTPSVPSSLVSESGAEGGDLASNRSYRERVKPHRLRCLQERIPRLAWRTGCRGLHGGMVGRQTKS